METMLKAIEIALENESKERDFYLKHSERTKNPAGKTMFAAIAGEEDDHYNYFKEVHQRLINDKKWPENVSAMVKGTNIKKVLASIDTIADKSDSLDADDKKAIRIAIDFEKKGHAFYSKLQKEAENEAEKSFFRQLAAVEYQHLASLEDTLLFFEDPAGWYAKQEKPTLDG